MMVIRYLIFYDVYFMFALISSRIPVFHLDYVRNNVYVCCTIVDLFCK